MTILNSPFLRKILKNHCPGMINFDKLLEKNLYCPAQRLKGYKDGRKEK